MRNHYISFKDPPECPLYDYIKKGKKTVEGRKNSEQYQKMKVGDYLHIIDEKGNLKCRVTYIRGYHTVKEYLEEEKVSRALPCVKTVKEGINIYELFVPKEEIERLNKRYWYGFLGIGIEFIEEYKQMYVKDPWFTYIKEGRKTIEGRLNRGRAKRMKKNDKLVLINRKTKKRVKVSVMATRKYDSIKAMIEKEGLEKVLPETRTVEEGVAIYREFYPEEKEKEFGVIAIEVKVMESRTENERNKGGYHENYMRMKSKLEDKLLSNIFY